MTELEKVQSWLERSRIKLVQIMRDIQFCERWLEMKRFEAVKKRHCRKPENYRKPNENKMRVRRNPRSQRKTLRRANRRVRAKSLGIAAKAKRAA